MAEGVVDRLEAVQVEVADADPPGPGLPGLRRPAVLGVLPVLGRALRSGGPGDRGEPFEEERPVGQPGHRIVHPQVAHARLQLPPGADVGHRQQRAPGPVGPGWLHGHQ